MHWIYGYRNNKRMGDITMIKAGEELLRLQAENQRLKEGIKKAREKIQKLRGCSCSCSDGIIDDVEDILDKLIEDVKLNET